MLIHAMEVSPISIYAMRIGARADDQVCGITGTFSRSCEVSMEVLRDNRESLMAVLEAFVYDPLLAWRLTATNQPGGRVGDAVQEVSDEAYKTARKNKASENEILNGQSSFVEDYAQKLNGQTWSEPKSRTTRRCRSSNGSGAS